MAKSFGGGSLKRLFSLVLGVALALGILPGLGARVALAEDTYTITVNGAAITTNADLRMSYECARSENEIEVIGSAGIVSDAHADKIGAMWFLNIKVNGEGQGSVAYKEGDDPNLKSLSINCTKNVVPVSSVSLDPVTATLEVGKSQTLKPTILPANATDGTVTWTSDKPEVATVATDGTVTGVAAGTATITATATNGTTDTADDKSATCAVTVTEPAPTATYTATAGAGATWAIGSTDGLAFTFKRTAEGEEKDTTLEHFKSASVDGKELTKDKDYTAAEGSVVVTLTPAYLNTLEAGEHTLTATFDDGAAEAKFTVADMSEPETTKSYPAPTMSNSRGGAITSQSAEITYTISQKVPAWASSVRTWVDLESVLQYTVDSSGVTVTCDGSDVEGAAVTIDGQRLAVTIADATALRGKTIQVAYKAKLRADADLTPYLNSAKTTASVPYQAHTVFDDDEANAVSSKSESVKFQVGSGSGTTKTASTSTKASTLAKTGDPASLASAAATALAGATAVLVGRRRRR